jgi:hypothetical protein
MHTIKDRAPVRSPVRAYVDDEEAPEPPSPTGQYPGPIWADDPGSLPAALGDIEEIPEPPSSTGQYPGPIWADDPGSLPAALGDEAPRPPQAERAPSLKDPDYAEPIGEADDPEQEVRGLIVPRRLDNPQIYQIIREVAITDSGDDLYGAVSADREYQTPDHPAYRRRHFGLGFGLVLFTQESGHLGSALRLMHQRDPARFAEVFGPNADALLAATNAGTAEERLRPVGGEVLWGPGWIERFRRAGAVPAFQAAQNEQAIEGQFRPMLPIAFALGLSTDRGLAMAFDRVVTQGLGGGLRWVVRAAGPLRTAAQRAHALEVLGFDDLFQFQAAICAVPATGRFGPETQAALVGALRRQGVIPMPTADELMGRLVAAATGTARRRLIRLRDSTNLTDFAYDPGQDVAPFFQADWPGGPGRRA